MKHFKSSVIFTIVCLLFASIWGYYEGGLPIAVKAVILASILGVLEVSLSFDNAVVNASVLEDMEDIWRHRFLTWGMVIAVFGMRLIFPVIIVSIMAFLDPISVIQMALTNPSAYAKHLTDSHHMISAFGSMFLMMIFLKFVFDPDKELHWIEPLEKQLIKVGKLEAFEIFTCLSLLLGIQYFIPAEERISVLVSGLAGLMSFILIESLSSLIETEEEELKKDGTLTDVVKKAGITSFIYLELLDASFSFDGVIGAFAITTDVITIAIGLGIGAMFVRSLTLYLVEKGTLSQYVFLEHGAHYAIGILAFIMLISTKYEISEVFTGLSGIFFIGVSLWSSIKYKKANSSIRFINENN